MKKRPYIELIVFLLLIFVLDRGVGLILRDRFINVNYGMYGSINNSLKVNADLLILGSSRAQHHYNPSIFLSNINVSSYNTGLGGYGIFYNYALLRSKVKVYKPKIVILDISPNVIVDPKSYSKMNVFFPYIDVMPPFLEIIKLNPDYSVLNRISKLYQYNSTLYDIVRSNRNKDSNLGFIPLKGVIELTKFSPIFLNDKEGVDTLKIKYFNKILNICENNNIRLFVIISPTFIKFDRNNRIVNIFKKICNKHSVTFYDYSCDKDFYGKIGYFTDQLHMNSKGANYFSQIVSKKIKVSILNDNYKNTEINANLEYHK